MNYWHYSGNGIFPVRYISIKSFTFSSDVSPISVQNLINGSIEAQPAAKASR
jgi:hypothetical protein